MLEVVLQLVPILCKDVGQDGRGTVLVEDAPVIPHESGQGSLKVMMDDDVLQLGDDLVEEDVFIGGCPVWLGLKVL